MKSYILLRDNKESGPYCLEELNAQSLSPTDLIWIEHESTNWSFANEIPELKITAISGEPHYNTNHSPKDLATHSAGSEAVSSKPRPTIYSSFPASGLRDSKAETTTPFFPESLHEYSAPFEPKKKKDFSINAGFFGLTVLLIGIMLCAFIVKKMVESFANEPSTATAQAQEIKAENVTMSTSVNAAKATVHNIPAQNLTVTDAAKKDSMLQKELPDKPSLITAKIIAKKRPAPINIAEKNIPLPNEKPDLAITEKKDDAAIKQADEKPEPKPVNHIASLQIAANDYKVGMFGGISNLELFITNPTSQTIEKAAIEVAFLKPNGTAVKSQTLLVENIGPGAQKKIAVPSNNRGVKVRYRVVSLETKQGKIETNDL